MRGTRNRIYHWVIALWLIMAGGVSTPASASLQPSSSATWKQPTMSEDIRPTYQFRSTSSCQMVVGQTSYMSTATYSPYGASSAPTRHIRRGVDDDDPSGEGVGEVDTPIGEPWVLLLFALGYVLLRNIKRKIYRKS